MKRTLLTLSLLISVLALIAQIPNGYYNAANGKTGDELKVALHNIVKGHHVVSYGGLLNAFAYTDCKPNGKIWDIYSNYEYSLSGSCGEYEHEGDCWNREHTWPQSWFNEQTTPRSDLFHVYPTDGYVNGQRSNYPYGEVNNPIYISGNGSKLGPCVISGYTGRVFEPIDEYKGDIARSYFYMSVRYYSEDDAWGTSAMTNKSVILPWAMTMLLRWSDEDPVSDKEIARNNAVYGYQNNRNPFIDHPEYARMIWDPNWQGGTYYDITCATGLSHGSVSAPESAMEGSTVAISATPELGYMVGTYTVYKTGSPNTTVMVSSNGTFTMPGYAVTVSATFVENNTFYNIALGTVSHGSISASPTSAKSGTNITLTANPENGYSLYAWYVFKTGDMNTTVSVNGNSFVMPTFNVTVMATFVQGSANGDFVKVTSAPMDWSGEYILVYEQSATIGYVWTGVDEVNSYVSKTISNDIIADDQSLITLTIASMSGGYSVKVNGGANNGKYIYGTSGSNKINFGSNPSLNTLSCESNGVKMVSNTSVMRYNNNSGQDRFRYFQSSTYTNQQPVQLYKRTYVTLTHTIHFNPNGGTGSMDDQTVNEFEPTALQANSFTKEGHVFEGWNTAADGTGDFYADGATVTLLDDLTLYAQWYYVQRYQLVTSADQLVAGRTYLIVNVANGKALGTTQNTNNRSAADVTIEDDIISTIDNTVCELTLGGSTGAWTFFDAGWGSNGGYLYAGSSSENQLKTQASVTNNGKWSIALDVDGVATIQAQGNNTRNLLKYNNSSIIFSCYSTNSNQLDVCLFRRTELEDYPAEQQVVLEAGWNWWAPIVMADNMLDQLLNAPGVLLVTTQGGDPASSIVPGQMYKIQTSQTVNLDMIGVVASLGSLEITIAPNVNWFGYPGTTPLDINEVNITAAVGDKIISQDGGFAIYNGSEWVGTLTSLQPCKGYVYYSTATQQKTLVF